MRTVASFALSVVALTVAAAGVSARAQATSSPSTTAPVQGALTSPVSGPATGWFGDWQLNVGRSTYRPGPAPYRRGTFRVEPAGDRVRMVYDLVPVRGGLTHMEWTGRFDGRDYPVQGVDQVITYAYTPVDERTMQVTLKVDGRVAADARVSLSADGTTLTTDTRVLDARAGNLVTTTTYERVTVGS